MGVLLCDVGDPASLAAMAKQTRVVLNCVGPVSCGMRGPVVRRASGLGAKRALNQICRAGRPTNLSGVVMRGKLSLKSWVLFCSSFRGTVRNQL